MPGAIMPPEAHRQEQNKNYKSLLYLIEELKTFKTGFLDELRKAKNGQESSVSYIAHTLPRQSLVTDGEEFQSLVIGGSVFKNALVRKNADTVEIESQRRGNLPVFGNSKSFIDFLKSQIYPGVGKVGINFGFPLEPVQRDGVLDGKLIRGTKEHKFEGLVGKNVGEFVEQSIGNGVKTVVANDTICLALSGADSVESLNQLAAGIVGTGLNFALIDGRAVVNLESGNFDKFRQTETGKEIDAKSSNPGINKLEKEIAGGFLYQHYNLLKGSSPEIKDSEELSILAESGNSLARTLLERSTMLTALQISAIVEFRKLPEITFVMEGSLFWKASNYRSLVQKYLSELGVNPTTAVFKEIPNSDVIGASRLVAIK